MAKILKNHDLLLTYDLNSSYFPTTITVYYLNKDNITNEKITNEIDTIYFNYIIDDSKIIKYIKEDNSQNITIKIYSYKKNFQRKNKAEENAATLIADILNRYNLTIDKVVKYQEHKDQYKSYFITNSEWNSFIAKINKKISSSKERPFLIGDTVYNKEDLYLKEAADCDTNLSLLKKNSKSVVKKYYYNKKLYMALGKEKTYYDIAWTDELYKFTTEKPTILKEN